MARLQAACIQLHAVNYLTVKRDLLTLPLYKALIYCGRFAAQ